MARVLVRSAEQRAAQEAERAKQQQKRARRESLRPPTHTPQRIFFPWKCLRLALAWHHHSINRLHIYTHTHTPIDQFDQAANHPPNQAKTMSEAEATSKRSREEEQAEGEEAAAAAPAGAEDGTTTAAAAATGADSPSKKRLKAGAYVLGMLACFLACLLGGGVTNFVPRR
jgi:hypothetical protein